ncbi:MAG: lysozyme [Paludibacter sp.]|nr:lysozyme [Paludibacter sp.]
MKASQNLINRLKRYEGFIPKPYLCPAGVPTIGFGSTRYPNGVRVSLRDKPISLDKAIEMLLYDVAQFEKDVTFLTKSIKLNQNQFDALVDFAYNLGSDIDIDNIPEGLGDSYLLKKILKNPNDKTIRDEFMKWVHSKGKVVSGLVTRRKEDADLFFTPVAA